MSSDDSVVPSTSGRYYALKGRPYAHLRDLDISPEVQTHLDALVDLADALGIDDLSFSTYSSAIDRLESEELSVTRSLLRTRYAADELTQHLLSLAHEERLIDQWTDALRLSSDTDDSVPTLERRKAGLVAKANEYKRALGQEMSDLPEAPPVTVTELAEFRTQLKRQEQILKEKRARVEAFQGLPPNIELARHALQEARDKQMELIQLRERLLGKMVDGVS
ncbi:hypothetical protein C8Q80DRAFT_105675 [Daedaleopsis nitida]|nr:hypothetical protein C8Q80DRAFT_105675 [Daedaleopsis nitida]